MCGIWAYFLTSNNTNFTENDFNTNNKRMMSMSSRGPDRLCEIKTEKYHMCFHRLAIHDLSPLGDQPFYIETNYGSKMHIMCNGEIYNYKELIAKYALTMKSGSDCEVIGEMLKKDIKIPDLIRELRGEFAFIIREEVSHGDVNIYVARDPYGVRPLYYAHTNDGIVISSLISGIGNLGKAVHVTPGTVMHVYKNFIRDDIQIEKYKYYDITEKNSDVLLKFASNNYIYKLITDSFIQSVSKRLDSERELGFLLSGGLDSSLVVAVASKILDHKNIQTFSVGMQNATDLKYAKQVAEHLGTLHTEVIFTKEEGLTIIEDVIRTLETYDITTIRASIGQYILAKYISNNTNIKVILNGDGADETECGYLYFHYAPSAIEAHKECHKLLSEIHMFDALRVDRTISSHGLEARVPFLDQDFVDTYLSIPEELRIPNMKENRMEKALIRDAFAYLYPDILPESVLYRKKEAFSDGVSTEKESWFVSIQKWIDTIVSDDEYEINRYPETCSKESYYYRKIFNKYFPYQDHILKHYWLPNWTNAKDPSARTLSVYN